VVVQLANDPEQSGVEVDVLPAKPERLGDTKARVGADGRDRAEGVG
jgi:hypothetical protein